ncbi:C-type lectin domain family 1 member A [Thomomys bottae]
MPGKSSSTTGFWDEEWDTATSLSSRAFTTPSQPQPRPAEHRTGCSPWRPVALTLLTLCLVLVTGLVALGFVFFQFYQLSNTQRESISEMEEKLQDLSGEIQSLRGHNRKLGESLQNVAQKLCRELYNKSAGHRCSPCPDGWEWYRDKCYQFSKDGRSWADCNSYCAAENATMLKIDTEDVLEFTMRRSYSEFFYSYWTGLARQGGGAWLWGDSAPHSQLLFEILVDTASVKPSECVTILHGKAFSKDCRELRRCACEVQAPPVDPKKLS